MNYQSTSIFGLEAPEMIDLSRCGFFVPSCFFCYVCLGCDMRMWRRQSSGEWRELGRRGGFRMISLKDWSIESTDIH